MKIIYLIIITLLFFSTSSFSKQVRKPGFWLNITSNKSITSATSNKAKIEVKGGKAIYVPKTADEIQQSFNWYKIVLHSEGFKPIKFKYRHGYDHPSDLSFTFSKKSKATSSCKKGFSMYMYTAPLGGKEPAFCVKVSKDSGKKCFSSDDCKYSCITSRKLLARMCPNFTYNNYLDVIMNDSFKCKSIYGKCSQIPTNFHNPTINKKGQVVEKVEG